VKGDVSAWGQAETSNIEQIMTDIKETGLSLVPQEVIENKILLIRGKKVMLDVDLAELYAVETKALNRAVKRNIERFPEDFMFQLTAEEFKSLRCPHLSLTAKGPYWLISRL